MSRASRGGPAPYVNPLRQPEDRRLPRIAGPSCLVMFGVTGDLSRKKLMPAVYDLANRGLLPPGFSLVGFARREWEDQDFAQVVYESVKRYARTEFHEEVWNQLAEGIRFVPGSFDDDEAFEHLVNTVDELDRERGTGGNYAFYLSIPPGFFSTVVGQIKKHGLATPRGGSWRRVVIEKPFGHDLESAVDLDDVVVGGVPARVGLPDRPLPRQGDRPEHPGVPLRQRAVRAGLELPLRRPRPDHDGRGHRHRRRAPATTTASAPRATSSRTTSSSSWRWSRWSEPVSFNARSLRLEKQKVLAQARHAGPDGPAHRTRPVRRRLGRRSQGQGLPRRGGHPGDLGDRDVRRDPARHRDASLGRRSVLPAHRQAPRHAG